MRNLKIVVQYDGTRYLGWQRQKSSERTVQGRLEQTLGRMTGDRVAVVGAARTDAGVHAQAQVANFLTESALTPEEILDGCRRHLPEDIAVHSVEEAPPRFHARYLARRKRYAYRICNLPVRDVFRRRYSLHVPELLDLAAMHEAARALIGRHDFRSFTSLKSEKKSSERTLNVLDLRREGGWVELYFEGDSFLYHMIRIITGTLLEVGRGRVDPASVRAMLEARHRGAAGPLAPAAGLCLLEVLY